MARPTEWAENSWAALVQSCTMDVHREDAATPAVPEPGA
jgi:hypothetical protein